MVVITDPVDGVPESMSPVEVDHSEIPIPLGATVVFDKNKHEREAGTLVGVNEHDRPIIIYIGYDTEIEGLTDHYRTTDWDAIEQLDD